MGHGNYNFNLPNKCTCTVEYLYRFQNVSYMLRRSLRRPNRVLFLSLTKPSAYCKVVAVVESQNMKCIICGVFTELLTIIKTILARCYDLKVFILVLKSCLQHVNTCW